MKARDIQGVGAWGCVWLLPSGKRYSCPSAISDSTSLTTLLYTTLSRRFGDTWRTVDFPPRRRSNGSKQDSIYINSRVVLHPRVKIYFLCIAQPKSYAKTVSSEKLTNSWEQEPFFTLCSMIYSQHLEQCLTCSRQAFCNLLTILRGEMFNM